LRGPVQGLIRGGGRGFDLVEDQAWPDAAALVTLGNSWLEVPCPSWYTGNRQRATWTAGAHYFPDYLLRHFGLLHPSIERSLPLDLSILGPYTFEIDHVVGTLDANFRAPAVDELVSYLGLFYMAAKKLEELSVRAVPPDPERWYAYEPPAPHDDFGGDVQRAMNVLWMRRYCRRSAKIHHEFDVRSQQ
jgi:hypothetical protein